MDLWEIFISVLTEPIILIGLIVGFFMAEGERKTMGLIIGGSLGLMISGFILTSIQRIREPEEAVIYMVFGIIVIGLSSSVIHLIRKRKRSNSVDS